MENEVNKEGPHVQTDTDNSDNDDSEDEDEIYGSLIQSDSGESDDYDSDSEDEYIPMEEDIQQMRYLKMTGFVGKFFYHSLSIYTPLCSYISR